MISSEKQLLAALREALLPPADAIATISHLLTDVEGEADVTEACFDDVGKIHAAAVSLYLFVKKQLKPDHFLDTGNFDEQLSSVRHDIKNLLNHIMGPCQFLLLDHPDGHLGRELDRIVDYSNACLEALRQQDGISIPIERPATPAPPRGRTTRHKTEPASVLVADDNATNREILERFLTTQNHSVTFASDGREALELIDQHSFDLVLLDIIMPEVDGFQVLQEMHDSGKLRYIPVIVLTGLDDVRDAVRCIEMGAEDFLSRPIQIELLRARVDACLEKKRLREQLYEQFFPPKLAREIVRHPDILEMKGRKADVSILFCDIRGFSTISERLGPSETIRWLRDALGVLSDCVMRHGGVLVDFTGDELMAMWGAPEFEPNHATLACTAALDMLAALPELDRRWSEAIGTPTAVGIGVNTGEVFVGHVGTSQRFKYGPLGNTVNLASRVQGATKYLRSTVLVTGQTHSQLGKDHPARKICHVKVNNIEEPVELYELALPGQDGWETIRDSYEQALAEFLEKRFHRAASILGNILVEYPHDGPTLMLMSRAVESMLTDGAAFNPVWILPGK